MFKCIIYEIELLVVIIFDFVVFVCILHVCTTPQRSKTSGSAIPEVFPGAERWGVVHTCTCNI